eukprot:TRINITY_DN9386_c0_g1_i1.p1 TRINITY_DN9386_c0_g1~~TRINITY_DN9386_c0_g1_i1.p1  ORF type:complete len:160 (-),score=19.42 TRINITY_DN9386_c0_g1_i1:28-507(-)
MTLELVGNKWHINDWNGNQNLQVKIPPSSFHYVSIQKCKDSVVQIKGKMNGVIINNCERVSVVLENAISVVEVVHSKKTQIQVTGNVPTIQLDKCEGVTLYLPRDCSSDIVTSLTTEVKIVLPGVTEESDPSELPVPEQYKTNIVGGKLVTVPTSHIGV